MSARPVPKSRWIWCGYAGHFIAARDCAMHMNTRVGDYRISTIGDYRPRHLERDEMTEVGCDRKFETYVFRVAGEGEHGEGEVVDWGEIDSDGYNEPLDAERGHMAMCERYARVAVGLETEGWEATV